MRLNNDNGFHNNQFTLTIGIKSMNNYLSDSGRIVKIINGHNNVKTPIITVIIVQIAHCDKHFFSHY